MEETKLVDGIKVNSFDIKGDNVIDSNNMPEIEAQLKEQLSEEEMALLQEEFKKEVERLEDKYQIVDAHTAETIELEDVNPIEAMRLIESKEDLYAFTEMKDGLGLSGSQLGLNKKFFVARDMMTEDGPFKMYFNPKYFPNGSSRMTFKEACLTYPGEQVDVKRWKGIAFHWFGFDEHGEWKKFKMNVKGLNAIILQHETDHCSGYPGGTTKPRTIKTIKKGRK